jgi:AraC family transcriptional regulator
MTEPRKNLTLKLRHLISKAAIKLIELHFQHLNGIDIHYIHLGEVSLFYDAATFTPEEIKALFCELGFEIMSDPEDVIVEHIRIAAIELIYYANNVNSLIRNSDYISERLQLPYEKLSRIYSRKTGNTLEHYLIGLKIEKAKELILDGAYTLSEIAYMLGYSSVQYLSNQFKKTTGLTVSQFKEDGRHSRVALEDIT